MTIIDKIGRMVKARTTPLSPAGNELIERGWSDTVRLDSDPELLAQVDTLRNSPDWPERVRAWEKVREMGPSVSGWKKALRDLIRQGDGWGRIFAAESLAWHACCEDEAVPVLLVALTSTLELNRHEWSRLACGAISRYDNLARPLVARSVPAMLEALEAGDDNVQGYAAMALGNWGKESRPALVKLADLHDRADEPLRGHYLQVMRKIDPSIASSQDARIKALDDQDGGVRAHAVTSMVRNGSEETAILPHLYTLSRDENPQVRRNLALALGELQVEDEESQRRLKLLAEDDEPVVRVAAAYAFVRLRSRVQENLKLLRNALASENTGLRLFAAWALGEVGESAAWRCRSALIRAQRREKREEVRQAITTALGKLA